MHQENITQVNDNFEKYKERLSNFSNDFELGLFIFIAKKSFIWILSFFFLSLFLSFVYLRYTPPVYESSTILQIRTNNTANKVLNVPNVYEGSENNIAEGIELLRSKDFLKRCLSKLPLEIGYYAEGTFKQNEQYTGSPYTTEVKVKSDKITGIPIYINFINSDKGEISYQLGGNTYTQEYLTNTWTNTPHVELKILINNYSDIIEQQNMVKQNAYYFTINNIDKSIAGYASKLQVKLVNEAARTVKISFKDNNPKKAADIANSLANEFNSFDIERKSESSTSVLSFIDQQLESVYERLRNAESSIQTFKKENDIKTNEDIASVNISRYNNLEDQIISLELEEKVLDKITSNISNKQNTDIYSLLSSLAGAEYESTITNSLGTLHKLLIQKEEMLYEVTPNSEAVKSINFQVEIQKKLLIESVKSVKEKLKEKKENLALKVIKFENKYLKLPADELEYARLQRLFSINEKFYSLLLEKKTEYLISKAGFVPDNVILEGAFVSNNPVSPDKQNIIISSLLIAILLSFILILIRYLTHNKINSLNEISKYTSSSISVLGIIPRYRKDIPVSQLLVDKNPKSLIAEAFRSIRTNLQFISNDSGSKLIAVTSTISGEGKTFIAINLAGIIAYSGKKVIILDLDMRKPKIHKGFGVENNKGMSTMLIDRDLTKDCIQHSNLANLDFITAGPIPPNPSELIISNKMDEILNYLKTKYDIIIIDNPPVGLVTDGIEIIRKADYPIYIFRSEYSKKTFIQNVDRLINENSIKKLSIILNGVDVERQGYGYNYGYGYGYGYGYNYGYYEDSDIKKKSTNTKK